MKETGEGYMEAVNSLCEELELEQELVAKYLSKPIIEKLSVEAQGKSYYQKDLNFFPDDA